MRLQVVPKDTTTNAFSRKVLSWTYILYTGPRCPGLMCQRRYSSLDGALRAGEKKLNKLGLARKDKDA